MPEVSIIVPVYNTEKYLHKCVDSLLAQSFTDFELLLVNDGSPDNCGAICDKYAESDSRIRVIHKENGGASAARNSGIENAKGEYIAFCDSDDIVSPMWLERMEKLAVKNTLPIGAYCSELGSLGEIKELCIEAEKEFPISEYFLFNKQGIAGYICNTLCRREIVKTNRICFRERQKQGDYNEDLIFALSYIKYIDKIAYTGYADYFYNTHNDSLSRGTSKFYFEKYAEKYLLWKEFIEHQCQCEETAYQISDLATSTLYHFLVALRQKNNYEDIRKIVISEEMQSCLNLADISQENPYEIKLLKKKRARTAFVYYQIMKLKERQ